VLPQKGATLYGAPVRWGQSAPSGSKRQDESTTVASRTKPYSTESQCHPPRTNRTKKVNDNGEENQKNTQAAFSFSSGDTVRCHEGLPRKHRK